MQLNISIKKIVKKIWRYPLCRHYRRKLKVESFTIISSDCTGGCLSHDLGLRFNSPTINLIVPRSLDFFENLDRYLSIEPVPGAYSKRGEPVILLDGLAIVGVHYRSHEELIASWNKRRQRVIWDRIVIMTNSRFVSTEEDVERFARLPYPKVLFTKNTPKHPFEVYAPSLQKTHFQIG